MADQWSGFPLSERRVVPGLMGPQHQTQTTQDTGRNKRCGFCRGHFCSLDATPGPQSLHGVGLIRPSRSLLDFAGGFLLFCSVVIRRGSFIISVQHNTLQDNPSASRYIKAKPYGLRASRRRSSRYPGSSLDLIKDRVTRMRRTSITWYLPGS